MSDVARSESYLTLGTASAIFMLVQSGIATLEVPQVHSTGQRISPERG
jgi:hypothetical protein